MISQLPTIVTAAQQIRSGQLTPAELVEFCLERIEQLEDSLHAWVLVDAEGAQSQAQRLGQLARQGRFLGPLHGIPLGIKDIVDVEGMATEAGSPLREAHIARRDAELVTRLRQSGAIVLGKTVTTEFACFDPPPTRNPWNVDHTPGGSSSGSAAAVASGMCMAAIGSQTGGSIVRPASYCGVVGLKPTLDAVPLDGVVPVSFHLDHPGPITRCVEDAAMLFSVLAATPDRECLGRELTTSPMALEWKLLGGFFDEAADDSVRRVFRAAIEKLEQRSGALEHLELPPSFAAVHQMHRRIMAVEAAEYHHELFAEHRSKYGPHVASLIQEGLDTPAVDYAAALKHRRLFRSEMSRTFEQTIGITPATTTAAPRDHCTTGDPAFNSPWSYCGFPTITIPCGLTGEKMPIGLQLIGPPGGETELLRAAAHCERVVSFVSRSGG